MTYIIVLMLVSGAIAYVGDAIGTAVGKKRLSVFGLRPRWTALVVAVATGFLITLFTLTVSAVLSEDVRIALFSLDKIREETEELRKNLDEIQLEVSRLSSLKNGLESEKRILQEDVEALAYQVRIKETESVVFRKGEPLSLTLIKSGNKPKEVMKELTTFIISLSEKVRRRNIKVKDEIYFFTENREHLNSMAEIIANAPQDMVVGAVADENLNAGEELGNVRFMVLPNNLIFKKNQEIASLEIDGTIEREAIARTLQNFMEALNHEVVGLGMISNPLTGQFGTMSYKSMISFYDMVNRIKTMDRLVKITAFVGEDTYTIGPLNVLFRFGDDDESTIQSGE
ncbi:MAG: DUF3084 domain-containing protein [Candidatus Ozemobacteraceae bacterium]|jgi:uncharacterized protein (DUF3084 family)|nr:DUF3084 domain-containing protein [Candidatus Riflebacteria bacterium]NLV94999.1 DUF3084 domain-containing protein [Candidatus Riflebacteria bacterium]